MPNAAPKVQDTGSNPIGPRPPMAIHIRLRLRYSGPIGGEKESEMESGLTGKGKQTATQVSSSGRVLVSGAHNGLSREAIARIISATDLDAEGVDLDELAKDLEMNCDLCVGGSKAYSSARVKQISLKLRQIDKVARKLQHLLSNGEIVEIIFSKLGLFEHDPRGTLDSLITAVGHSYPAPVPRNRYANVFSDRSRFELLAGIGLRGVFEAHFRRAGISRGASRKPDGPYIRFAYQSLIELEFTQNGKPYSQEAIARALTSAKSNRIRRKINRPDPLGKNASNF
jgi:hypothetical protein